jgi:tol-pal system protein YbgF
MHLRLITSGALALLLLSAPTGAFAGSVGTPSEAQRTAGHEPSRSFRNLFGLLHRGDADEKSGSDEAQLQLAQAADPRVTQLEEEIRRLSGTIEELNFQVLQMQEQMRKMQEDSEFRFQELEKGGAAATGKKSDAASPARSRSNPSGAASGQTTAETQPAQPGAQAPGGNQDGGIGAPEVNLGTITVDKDGNVESSNGDQSDVFSAPADPSEGATVAALPSTDDPDELYRNAYEFVLAGDYPTAEAGFRDHITRFPADPKAADAHYWLGESMLAQRKYRDAAEVFLQSNRDYPDAAKAPDMLLKLGVSLNKLNQHDVACATFREVGKRYPNSSAALRQKHKQEQALAAC